jgi:uncharacterized repeat protein (TIGR02543 family)
MNGHGSAIEALSVIEGMKATEPAAPTADGYLFRGWYIDAECTTLYDFNAAVTADIELYAKWLKIETHTVTLHFEKPAAWGNDVYAWIWLATGGAVPGYDQYQTEWPGAAIPDIDADSYLFSIAVHCLLQKFTVVNRGCSEYHAVYSRFKVSRNCFHIPYASAYLYESGRQATDCSLSVCSFPNRLIGGSLYGAYGLKIRGRSVSRSLEIHHMDTSCTCRNKVTGYLRRAIAVNRHLSIISFIKSHSLAFIKVYRRIYKH